MGIDLTNEQVYCIYALENWWNKREKQVFEISGAAGTGKALAHGTNIPTPDGNKKIEDITVNDLVFNRHGDPVKVTGVYPQGKLKTYKVGFDDGSYIKCNDEHIWTYMVKKLGNVNTLESTELKNIIKDTEINGYTNGNTTDFRYKIPLCFPIQINPIDLNSIDEFFNGKNFYNLGRQMATLIEKNMIDSIRDEIIYSSINQRIDFLMGIFDNIGNIGKDSFGYLTLKSNNINLLLSLKTLISSLGVKSIITKNSLLYPKYTNDNSLYLQIMVREESKEFFFKKNNRNKKKLINELKVNGNPINSDYLGISSIEELNEESEMTCIMVDDEEHLFLCGPFIPTHNTTIVKYFIERLGLSYENVLFVAYMGKAATQLIRNGLPAKTIHSAIYEYVDNVEYDEYGHMKFDEQGKIIHKREFILKESIGKKIKLIVVDEASMINKDIAEDLLSFNIPVVALGDLNQLPPVFGNPYFLVKPDFILTQIMRQAEGSPIIYLSQKVLNGEPLKFGSYGTSFVIPKSDISDFHFKKADIVLTGTNKLRYNINNYFRENLKRIKNLEYPHINEKVVCRKNNWDMRIDDGIYLTNGMTGFIDYVYRDSYNKRTMKIDFRPDFSKKTFKKVEFDYKHLYEVPGQSDSAPSWYYDRMEFAYAISVHTSQGSQWPYVLYLFEDYMVNDMDRRRMMYTAITRASETIGIVL